MKTGKSLDRSSMILNNLQKPGMKTGRRLFLKAGRAASGDIDLTLPGDPLPIGARHPISLVRNQVVHIFGRLGFSVEEGPEIEDDWHNFYGAQSSRKSSCA